MISCKVPKNGHKAKNVLTKMSRAIRIMAKNARLPHLGWVRYCKDQVVDINYYKRQKLRRSMLKGGCCNNAVSSGFLAWISERKGDGVTSKNTRIFKIIGNTYERIHTNQQNNKEDIFMTKKKDESITIMEKKSEDLEIYAGAVENGGDSLTFVINLPDDGNPELDSLVTVEEVFEYCKRHKKVLFFIAESDPDEAIEDISEFFVWLVKGGADTLLR